MRYIEIDARELLWDKEALDFYNYLAEKVKDHPAGKKYLEKYFRNKILNNDLDLPLAKETDYNRSPSKSKTKFIKKALDNNELYLVKFDDFHKRLFTELFDYICTLDKNKPINIPYQEIPKIIQKYHKRFKNLKQENEDLERIKPIYEFKDGYKWVSIESQQGLKRESSLMQHCVGEDPQYWNKIKDGKILVLSLRDKQNKPHITIEYEIKNKVIRQVQGKQDLPPRQKYISPYLEFLLLNVKSPIKFKKKFENDKVYYGMLYQNKHFYSPFDLPDNFTWIGDLDLSYSKKVKLPEGLEVEGNLDLTSSEIEELPKNLKITGDLDLSYSKIVELPEGLKVEGNLYTCYSKITEVPETIYAKGLIMFNSPIRKLPKNLKITGDLDLSSSKIIELPKDLEVGGNLDLTNSKIMKLPKGLKVGGNLDLFESQILLLPEGLEVGGDLNLYGTKVAKLPNDLKVGGELDIRYTKITTIPEGLKFKRINQN